MLGKVANPAMIFRAPCLHWLYDVNGMRTEHLRPGDPAPWFACRAQRNERYMFHMAAGRYIVLCFFGSAGEPRARTTILGLQSHRAHFDDVNLTFFGVSTDPLDEREVRIRDSLPGIRYLWDFDRSVSAVYGAIDSSGRYNNVTYILDPNLQVVATFPWLPDSDAHLGLLKDAIDAVPAAGSACVARLQAPILLTPRVFEPDLCSALIDYLERNGATDSGFMRDVNGKTIGMLDHDHKRRRDCEIIDGALRELCRERIRDRLLPEVRKSFQFHATRIERYIVACYDGADKGHFRPHRDNTTKGTAHRRFAVSLFLNTGAYDGGFLRFPEYGAALYTAQTGGAVIFSCSLLHEATPVIKGRRYMFLPFLYDETGRRIRTENESS